ncbi:APC family permease [Flavobacterium flavigenum]|uniref:APC family permease n=1 Tax=Flavobacterium flavigenum TaxID=3003258 RepID=UPI002482CA30|nr:amino acid permease [Flavobacterium flavigenum]
MKSSTKKNNFKRSLGLLDATMIVAGSMIGSGIFIVSADIVRNVGSAGALLLVWLLTGFLTIAAALSYGELSAMFPKAGGQYVYLRESFNSLTGFLYGWSFFAVIQTGSIAAVGVAFSKFSAYVFPSLSENNILLDLGFLQISAAQLTSIILVVFLTYINTRGVKEGKIIQTVFTLVKLIALFGLIIFGFILAARADVWKANWSTGFSINKLEGNTLIPYSGFAIMGAVAASLVGSLFSSDSWNNVTFIAREIKNPSKNIGRSLFLGTLIVSLIYIATNIMYLSVLTLDEIAHSENDRVGVAASQHIFGASGTYIIAILLMVSTFGCNNGLILSGARVYHRMAKDGLFFKKLSKLNKNGVPEKALWMQCIWASVLCLSGKYNELLDYVIFVVLIFYILTIAGIFRLRKTKPELDRPYKAIGYPVLPAIYIVTASSICIMLLIYKYSSSLPGLAIVLLGIPIYYYFVNKDKKDK